MEDKIKTLIEQLKTRNQERAELINKNDINQNARTKLSVSYNSTLMFIKELENLIR